MAHKKGSGSTKTVEIQILRDWGLKFMVTNQLKLGE